MMSRALSGNGKIKGVSLATEPGISLIILSSMRILQRYLKRTTGTFLFISHTTNVLLFKFRCNTFIGFISVFNQLDAQNLFYNRFYFMSLVSSH